MFFYNLNVFKFQGKDWHQMDNHPRKHSNVRFKCDECDFETANKYYLKVHLEMKHQGVRYPCNVCGMLCASKNSLKKHQQCAHEGVKYTCDICGYEVSSLSGLWHHKEGHMGQMHPCPQCDKAFNKLKMKY